MNYTKEWMGTQIEIVNTLNRTELKIDGSTQDFLTGIITPKNAQLKGTNKNGDNITVKFKNGLLMVNATMYFNDKEIYRFKFVI